MERVIRWTFASGTLAQAAKMSLSRSPSTVTMAAPANTILAWSAVAIQRCDSLFSERRFSCATLTRPWRVQICPPTKPRQLPLVASIATMPCSSKPRPPRRSDHSIRRSVDQLSLEGSRQSAQNQPPQPAAHPQAGASKLWDAQSCIGEASPPFVEAKISKPTQRYLFERHHDTPG